MLWHKLSFKGRHPEAFEGRVTSRNEEKSNVEEMEEERRKGDGRPEGSLKAQCVRENRSVPSPRQPTAQAH